MESDLELSMASKAGESVVGYSQEQLKRIEECARFWEEFAREKKARDEVIKRNDGDAKMEDYNAEEMNIMAKEKMLRRRRERLMRHFRRRQTAKKDSKSQDSEMKRLMEKAIREARDEVINAAKIEDSKAEEMNIADEKTFPRRRGRLIRYLRRQRSKSQDSDFQIEFQQPMAEESFSDYSDE